MYRSLIFFTYAKQARAIVNLARVNEDPKARMIRGKNRIFKCILKQKSQKTHFKYESIDNAFKKQLSY